MSPTMRKTRDYRHFAEKIVVKAGKFLLETRKTTKICEFKDIVDFVTNKDLEIEEEIIHQIEAHFPEHTIISEERGEVKKNSGYRWIIDPLDGTKEYQRGLSNFSICMLLEYEEKPVISVIYVPSTRELFSSENGKGAFQRNIRLHVSDTSTLEKSFILFHTPSQKCDDGTKMRHWSIAQSVGLVAYKTFVRLNDNMILCDLAKGGYDGYVHVAAEVTPWWDVAPGLAVAREAGAMITDVHGRPLTPETYHTGIVVSNGHIHQQLLDTIHGTS